MSLSSLLRDNRTVFLLLTVMLRHLVLPIFLLAGACAINCPNGYTDDRNGNCQSGIFPAQTYFDAYTQCARDGGYLINIRNAFENTNLGGLIEPIIWFWVGLTCTSSSPTSCVWDNGAAVNVTSYTNFFPANPMPSTGACVAYNAENLLWYSSMCNDRLSFICRITPGINVPNCPAPSHYFRGRCYSSPAAVNLLDAGESCRQSGAQLASIHSDGENSMVRDVAVYTHGEITAIFIDLHCTTDICFWGDGSNYDYSPNEFLPNPSSPNCVLLDSKIDGYSWYHSECNESFYSVCKQVSGAHAHEHIDTAVDAFEKVGKKLGVV